MEWRLHPPDNFNVRKMRWKFDQANPARLLFVLGVLLLAPLDAHANSPVTEPGAVQTVNASGATRLRFTLKRGEVIADAMLRWARSAGWTLELPESSWLAPADTEFEGDFQQALSSLVTQMVRQGATIQLHLWPVNRAALIIRTTP